METVGMSMGSVPLPQSHTATIVVWNDLDLENSESLLEAPTLKDVKEILAEIFKLYNYATVQKEGILLNLYTYAVQFAREEDFTNEQLSAYFSIVKRVHEVCVESPFGNLEETFTYFKDLLVSHSVCRPPFSIELFSSEEIKKISDHVIKTYFRHFKLYKFAFTQQVRLDLVLNYTGPSDSDASQEIQIESEKEEKEKSESEESQEEIIINAEKEVEMPPESVKG
ncbi:cilia- and flagella-associated protein 119 [Octopus bimaculoides]|uniref:Coiled-coil domain-containing protein 189 n=1 Tax=Octopus bimaculoides TaxID=37653 RepID=A0A0L8FRZ9_OCTBM|nr:cilia- and flagella-associated protein 119 [Octopus bimaculoides]|eukprot:XP_014787651.1 PREDICTED: coiled-coil domain-containing protein C16orf93 homolog [Octopus bimaculoides]